MRSQEAALRCVALKAPTATAKAAESSWSLAGSAAAADAIRRRTILIAAADTGSTLGPRASATSPSSTQASPLRFYKTPLEDVVVLYDELDLAPGKVRIKKGGGSGGHNGIRSLDAHIGKDYRRMRIGIGHPGHKDKVTGHVLGDFAKADHIWLDPLLDEIARNAELLAQNDDAGFMNRLALRTQSNEPSGAKGQSSAKKTGKSHIRQARKNGPKGDVPKSGPMADMLKKLFSGNQD